MSKPPRVTLAGTGLHTGRAVELRLERRDGPLTFTAPGARGAVPLPGMEIARSDHGVELSSERHGFSVDSVEHFLSALGGLRIRSTLSVEVQGGEMPLLDGGALEFARALRGLGIPPEPPPLCVLRAGQVTVGASRYEFAPGASSQVSVRVDFDAPLIGVQSAAWDGTPEAYVREVAWARTFGFVRDAEALRAAGRAGAVDPRTVLVLAENGEELVTGELPRPAEFARHKLLDMIGDLYLFGGPPVGSVHAERPGHTATLLALKEAEARGLVGGERPGAREAAVPGNLTA